MLLSTRDAQRERRHSYRLAASVMLAERLSDVGLDNTGFQRESTTDLRAVEIKSARGSLPTSSLGTANDEKVDSVAISIKPSETKPTRRYRWKMGHYFYLHMFLFVFNSLLGGLIVYLIENHSSVRNTQMTVTYIDSWFVCSTCVYCCGLTTLDFAKLSRASQLVLMFFTFVSGITISTLPALAIKAYTHKHVSGIRVDDDHGGNNDDDDADADDNDDDELPTFNIPRRPHLPDELREKLGTLPRPAQLRYRAYVTCIVLTLGTCLVIYTIPFVSMGSWLTHKYEASDLMQGNASLNPWYISFVVTLTGFNQNGMSPFSTGFANFVDDVFLNVFVMLVGLQLVASLVLNRTCASLS
jgi:Trk-type K+ transport system membrane component